ncbi:unnamed protein product [Didymodactylos carnosus]|uniref:mitogen-activated protein kinase kinase n=3 Tax=Didymodactylos carnosus TaxID=1234261 RepID=A0A814DI47_9BILA|nr:unnamed protein product [Didymodactylos carnosus]CAF3733539.1 unnamed protein product [Didymodactylos carnosus]
MRFSRSSLQVPTTITVLKYEGETINLNINDLDIQQLLGSGEYGIVSYATLRSDPNIKMAVKRIRLETNDEKRLSTYTDLTTIERVGTKLHPYIVKYFGSIIDKVEGDLLIFMELMDTSMDRFYRTVHERQDLDLLDLILRRVTFSIVSALNFLKYHRILHRDVKPQNILVNRQCQFKLCDFGICGYFTNSKSVTSSFKGTNVYLPPERMKDNVEPYGIRSDIWALGISLVEIANGKQPFLGIQIFDLADLIQTWIPNIDDKLISFALKELILYLLKTDYRLRPMSYDEILGIPILQSVHAIPSNVEMNYITHIINNIVP